MLRAIAPIMACFGMLTIVACGGRDPVAAEANDTAGLPAINEPAPDATGSPPADAARPANSAALPAAASKIPAALHGRWGLAPADCTSTRGDAKGLLTISADDLRFYESRAIPGPNVEGDADSISGDFAFSGEGQTWTRYQALKVRGHELVRTEINPAASFTYAKCT
jgi:hypothetical protein